MATATIRVKKGTTAEWTESHRVLDDGEMGIELTTDGHRIIRIGDGVTEFIGLPISFDIEEVRAIKTGMEDSVKTYYDGMVKRGEEFIEEIKAMTTTVEVEDDVTGIKYRMGLSAGTMYFEEMEKETITPEPGGDMEDVGTGESSEESGKEETGSNGQEVIE